jgi:type IV pilus assembly protein PilQ
MRKWFPLAAPFFLLGWSVYADQANFAGAQTSPVDPDSAVAAGQIRLMNDGTLDTPATQPAIDSGSKVVMNDSGTFSIQINNDIDLLQVLRMIANQAQISIIPGKDVHGTVPAMDLYNVTVSEALDAILQTNGMHWKKQGNFIFVYSETQWQSLQKSLHVRQTKVYTLNYVTASDAADLIKPALSADAMVQTTRGSSTGLSNVDDSAEASSSSGDTGGNSLAGADMIVVSDYPENLSQVDQILAKIDRRPQQVLMEATILEATLNENNAMGIDFSFMGGVDMDTLLDNGIGVAAALSGNILNPAASSSGSSTGGTTSSGTPAPVVASGYTGFTTGNYDTQVPAGGLQIGLVRNNLGLFISALEAVTDATVLANPKVLVLNKQPGDVHVGQELGYQTTTVTQTTSTETVQYLDTGTILTFRPFIGDDGYIRIEIHPEDSTGVLVNNLPQKTTTEVTSNVMVKDGNTIVIGGLFRESSQTSRSQVPFLGSMPLAGPLFRSKADTTQREEIIILLTPHIVKDDAAYSRLSEQEKRDAELLRVGVRKGMMWFGRERLAESAYEDAVDEMNKPNPDVNKAVWHLDCATNLNPTFTEAILLKEKLTGKEVTDVDNSTIRSFVQRAILEDTAEPTTVPSAVVPDDLPPFAAPISVPPAPATRPAIATAATTRPQPANVDADDDDSIPNPKKP